MYDAYTMSILYEYMFMICMSIYMIYVWCIDSLLPSICKHMNNIKHRGYINSLCMPRDICWPCNCTPNNFSNHCAIRLKHRYRTSLDTYRMVGMLCREIFSTEVTYPNPHIVGKLIQSWSRWHNEWGDKTFVVHLIMHSM